MVNKDEVKGLADLARIKITDEEAEHLSSELDSILDYVGQIKSANPDRTESQPKLKNVFREDEPQNEDNEYTEDILNNAPKRNGRYIEVKKIL